MSRKGNCLGNSMMELPYLQEWDSVEQFNVELRKYIHYYNYDRIKLRLKGKSPVQYRTLSRPEEAS
ncbi:MAG: IS3 family transposase [Bacteroidales bacterium]|nr:IS3 family transposase [Bacteroidales bacterium]